MDLMLKIGVYQIRNLLNGKRYIGSTSTSFQRRWEQHLSLLKKGIHHAAHLQRSWNKYGAESFAYEIVEVVDEPDLVIAREQFWIDQYIESGELYNHSPTAGSTRGFRFSDESKARISATHRAMYNTPEARAIQAERARQLYSTEEGRANHAAGQKRRWENPEHHAKSSESQRLCAQDPEVKRRRSVAQRRRLEDPEIRERFNERNRRIAQDPEARAKALATRRETLARPGGKARMSQAQQRRFSTDEGKVQASQARRPRDEHGRPITYNLRGPDGTIYLDIPNVAAFCREHGLTTGKITSVLRGQTRRSEGWTRYDPPEHEQAED